MLFDELHDLDAAEQYCVQYAQEAASPTHARALYDRLVQALLHMLRLTKRLNCAIFDA